MSPITERNAHRRTLLNGLGVVVATGLAGCMGNDDSAPSNNDTDPSDNDTDPSGNDTDPETENEIVYRTWDDPGVFIGNQTVEISDNFAADRSDLSVTYSHVPFHEYHSTLHSELASGEAPDVFTLLSRDTPELVNSGSLLELSDRINVDVDQFYKSVQDEMIADDGSYYWLPKDAAATVLYYNQDVYDEAGVDIPDSFEEYSWNEYRASLEQIQNETDIAPLSISDSVGSLFETLLFQTGSQILNDDWTECVIASDDAVQALEYMVGLYEDDLAVFEHEINPGGPHAALGQQDVASTLAQPAQLRLGIEAYPFVFEDDTIQTSKLPVVEGGEPVSVMAITTWEAHAETEYPEEAAEFIDYWCTGDGHLDWVELGAGTSPIVDDQSLEFYQNNPRYIPHMEAMENAKAFSWGEYTNQIVERLNPRIQEAYQGTKTPREALEDAQAAINEDLFS